ncbi:nitrate/nitrite transporter NrtS [Trichlorobacter lovleyi]|uniref:Uncharacterized protein n=1 Tax=Trichlorobacter lovleyi (strain ATCC BAA-1151 / DSM 17278 / SZ) TaxID=398767 RepID=B3EBY8_TRIL1|nr:nitrate/nitrite transporter NrtS [Trichlorobacter lovleyi]ACD97420.1 hypothetical protein Glov_3722 [Trichlorobacter lovleyi SZ]
MNSTNDKMEWTTWPEAFDLLFQGVTLQTCIPVAIVVGLILSTINQSDVIISGAATSLTWVKVGMNFVVPFCVSSYGFLNARRTEAPALELENTLES